MSTTISRETVFAPVRSQTAFEETVERLGTAIKLGLLTPGQQLPPERELCAMLGIARSTLRQALTALAESGHLHAVRGRGGGTFIADPQPPADPPSPEQLSCWHLVCDQRFALELGVAALAVERADDAALDRLEKLIDTMDGTLGDFGSFRQSDILFHVGLAEATGNPRLVSAITEVQGEMTDLINHIAHPREVLASSNSQHRRLLGALRDRDEARAVRVMSAHLRATEQVLGGLLPAR